MPLPREPESDMRRILALRATSWIVDICDALFFWSSLLIAHLIQTVALRFGFDLAFIHILNTMESYAFEISVMMFLVNQLFRAGFGYYKSARELVK